MCKEGLNREERILLESELKHFKRDFDILKKQLADQIERNKRLAAVIKHFVEEMNNCSVSLNGLAENLESL